MQYPYVINAKKDKRIKFNWNIFYITIGRLTSPDYEKYARDYDQIHGRTIQLKKLLNRIES